MTSDIHTTVHPIEQYMIDTVTLLRKEHNLTTKQLGKIINTSASFVSNVESPSNSAKYNMKHIYQVAKYFKLSPKHFLPENT